jgi:hypothetical protein
MCREGLRLAERPGGDRAGWAAYQWAPLADRAAELADASASADLRIQAFTLAVSTRRLVALHSAAETHRPGDTSDADAALSDLLEQLLRERTSTTAERAGWRRAGQAAVDR